MNCVIVDDDPFSIRILQKCIGEIEWLTLVETRESVLGVEEILRENNIDILFLDVEMPELNAFDFLNIHDVNVKVILVTSKKDYALKAFNYGVFDYLLKPIDFKRFVQAIEKARQAKNDKLNETNEVEDSIFIKSNGKLVKLYFDDILWIESLADYVKIFTPDGTHVALYTMKKLEEILKERNFMRVHRSYIVNFDKIDSFDDNMLVIGKQSVPVSKTYRSDIMKRINVL